MASSPSFQNIADLRQWLEQHSRQELEFFCKNNSLPTTGTHAELVECLIVLQNNHLLRQQNGAPVSEQVSVAHSLHE